MKVAQLSFANFTSKIMVDLLKKLEVRFTLFLMVCELSYVNAQSLLYIVDNFGIIHKVFAVIGAIAFSRVTIVIMRRSNKKWLKIAFPVFDACLVFCGLNVRFYDKMFNNPICLGLTVFMAIFTGLIMYSLGTIDSDSSKTDPAQNETQLKLLQTDNNSLQTELAKIKSQFNSLQTDIDKYKSEIEKYKTDISLFKPHYLKSERSRILKKNEGNRTDAENQLLQLTNEN
jgi:hypothetical protein